MPRFMIKSAMNTGYNLNIYGGSLSANTAIILYQDQPAEWNSIWQVTPDGVIACAADPTLVLAPAGAGGTNDQGYWLQLSQRNPGDESQQWVIEKVQGYGAVSVYTIKNKQSGQYIDANCGPQNFQQGQQVLTWPNTTPGVNEYWVLEDVDARPTAVYIQTDASGGLNTANPFVLDLATLGNTLNDNIYNCVVNPWVQGKLSQAWHFNSDGTITSARTPLLALTATGHEGNVEIQPLVANTLNQNQHWGYDESNGQIAVDISNTGTEYLNVAGGAHEPQVGNQVITWVQGNASNYNWIPFDYAVTVPGQPVALQVNSNNQLYALAIASGQSGAGANVVLQAVQQGQVDMNQLWCLYPNGIVLSFQDQSLALTYPSQDGQPVTLQVYDSQNAQQQSWWVQNDSVLAANVNTWTQYLDASSGYADQATLTLGGSGVQWTITPYQPAGHPGQWFTIRSGQVLPGGGTPSLLTLALGNKLTSSVPLGQMFGAEAMAGINQLWRLTLGGALISAIDPTLVVTVTGSALALAADTGALEQQWQWAYSSAEDASVDGKNIPVLCGVLQNMGTGAPVLMSSGASGTGNTVSAAAMLGADGSDSPDNYPAQLWYIAPHMPAFDQPTRLTLIQPGTSATLVLALQGDTFTPGTPVVVVESSSSPATMTWQFTDTGQIVNTVNPQAVLSLEGGNSGSQQALAVYPLQPGNQPFQSWALTAEGLIYNMANMQVLTVSVANGAATLATASVVEDGAAGGIYQRWDVAPSPALMTVLMQPPIPYPVATAGSAEAAAYVYINAMLGLQPQVQGVQRDNPLRAQYGNLAAPLSSYQRKLNTLKCPKEISDTAWTAVVDQLDAELTAAIGVQALFVQMSTFHLMFSQAQAMALPSLITAVQLAETDKVTIRKKHAWIWDMCIGLANTLLNGVGTMTGEKWAEKAIEGSLAKTVGLYAVKYGSPALGNLLNTSLNLTQAVLQSKRQDVQRDIDFEMTVLQLQQKLLQTFQAMGATLGETQALVFQDWGRLRAVYEMTTLIQGGASLYWPSILAPTQVDQLLPGYINSVLQMLMPNSQACQTIYRYSEQNQQPLNSPGLQSDLVSYVDHNADGTQTTYTVGQSTPTQQMTDLMTMVWSNGVNPFQFFHAQAGWSEMIIEEGSSSYTGYKSTFMVAYVQNFTAQSLSIDAYITGNKPEGQIWGPINPVPLSPYGISTFAAATSGVTGQPIHGALQIKDSSGNVLATGSFNCEGTSHNWGCAMVGTEGYRVTSSYQGVVDDMINWNIGFYAD